MSCTNPQSLFLVEGEDRKVRLHRHIPAGRVAKPVTLPCGRCMHCRVAKVREWEVRCWAESRMHENSLFLTLTYNDDNLPSDWSVNRRHPQLFLKRLRKWLSKTDPEMRIKFFLGAEYGDQLLRPHYHCILFGVGLDQFPDAEFYKMSGKERLYRSQKLNDLWSYGYANFGVARRGSMNYAAGYAVKKIEGKGNPDSYRRYRPDTGETWNVEPEFGMMSGGLGRSWVEKYRSDFSQDGSIVIDGKHFAVPPYFRKLLKDCFQSPDALNKDGIFYDDLEGSNSRKREWAQQPNVIADNTPERRKAREESLIYRTKAFDRSRAGHE